jgi:hypothetical protein
MDVEEEKEKNYIICRACLLVGISFGDHRNIMAEFNWVTVKVVLKDYRI